MCGFIPFVYTIAPFLVMRPFEYIRNDICEQNVNVKFVGIGAGFAYSTLGPTHHATEDVSIMRCLPNLTIISPADPLETRKAARAAYEMDGPVYLRIGTGRNPAVYENNSYSFKIGKAVTLRAGGDVALISTSTILRDVCDAADELANEGISVRVINMHTIKPIDIECVLAAAEETKGIICVEEHTIIGGLGSAVAEILADHSAVVPFVRMGLQEHFAHGYGTVQELRTRHGFDRTAISVQVRRILTKKNKR